tara:strand:- start:321 stop:1385 length:1065 start_codon:yes stop_codon:yes gene_type:complete
MKKYLFIFVVILLTGCGATPEEKMAKIDDIENAIYITSKTLNLTNEDYEVLSIEFKEKEADSIIQRRDGLYRKLMSSFLDPETSLEIKNKIIVFFQSIDNQPISMSAPHREDLYMKLMSSFLDPEVNLEIKNKIIMFFQNIENSPVNASTDTEELKDKKYLNLSLILSNSLFDIETKIFFYKELASLEGLASGLDDEFYLKNQLCNAVEDNQLAYASLLVDFGVDMFNPGKIRCTDDKSSPGMALFTGNTVGMMSDSDVKSKLKVCPMSLRRISGRNYGRAVSARISSWQSSVRQIDRDSIKSLDDAKDKIKRTFTNVPSLNPVPGSMNALLDRYDKTWMPGGDCSLESNARFH